MIQFFQSLTHEEWLARRVEDITSTEISALFGLSPYMTEFELWHNKRNKTVVALEPNDRIKWGTRLESSIAAGIAEDQGWQTFTMPKYVRDTERRLGSSFDFGIGDDGILEIKNVDALQYREKWTVDGDDIEAPPHIELQLQLQLMVTGRKYAYIGALVGGNSVILIRREPQQAVFDAIKEKAAVFWESIADNNPPPPVFPDDAKFISSLYGYAEPDTCIQATPLIAAMAEQYKLILDEQKILEGSKATLKAKMLMEMGIAEKCIGDGFSVSAGTIGPAEIEAHTRAGYRMFRCNFKRSKA